MKKAVFLFSVFFLVSFSSSFSMNVGAELDSKIINYRRQKKRGVSNCPRPIWDGDKIVGLETGKVIKQQGLVSILLDYTQNEVFVCED